MEFGWGSKTNVYFYVNWVGDLKDFGFILISLSWCEMSKHLRAHVISFVVYECILGGISHGIFAISA